MNLHYKNTAIRPPIKQGMQKIVTSLILLSMFLLAGMGSSPVHALPVTSPVGGEIEKITINDVNDHWSGGVIVAGGQNIIIPKNLLIDLPANRVTLQQLFTEASASCQTQGETGLAKGDACNGSGTGGIATIQANRLENGNVIAGDVFIEKAAESVTGQITYIDYDQGYFRVNGVAGSATEGVMVRLNDPDGRHTLQTGLGCAAGSPNCSADPRFTLDGDNYTNVFSTGFPLCIPSTQARNFSDTLGLGATTAQANSNGNGDVLCPNTNRPGQPVADSRRFAPILVGDSITAEGNYEEVDGVHFLSAHSTMVSSALSTKADANQPDYFFLDEVEFDAPGFQNQRARTLVIGYSTLPPDIMLWTIHYDPVTNTPHEFPFATTTGCDTAAGIGTCTAQGLVPGAGAGNNIFKIRHDVDFLVATKKRWDPCAHLRADPRFNDPGATSPTICPHSNDAPGVDGANTDEQFAILSPIPHELQARSGRKFADMKGANQLKTIDIQGNAATNGQYLFPFGMGLGGIGIPEMVEINLNALQTPVSFTGIPWNLDRRLGPGGCVETGCEAGAPGAAAFALNPFPFEGTAMDPRTLSLIPEATNYADPNYLVGSLTNVGDRILSYVNPDATRPGNGIGVNDTGNFTTALLDWKPSWVTTPTGLGAVTDTPVLPQALICSANTAFNSPPVAMDDTGSTATDTPITINVLTNDFDINGDTLSVTAVTLPSNGSTVDNGDGTITYNPSASFSGTATFSYTVSDGQGGVDTALVTITVNAPSNNAPTALNDAAPTDEDTPVTVVVLGNDTDADGDTLSVQSVTNSVNGGSVTTDGVTVTYTPAANFNGTDTFTYVVSDGRGGTDTGLVTISVTPVNDAPVAVDDNATVTQDSGAKIINVLANDNDIDGGLLTVSLASSTTAKGGSVTTNGDTVSYTPAAGFVGTDSFDYTITDDGGLTATATVTVEVNALNLDTLTFTTAEYRTSKAEWRLTGTGSVDGKTVTLRTGSETGTIIGSSPVAVGVWTIRIKGSSILPNGSVVYASSTGGGSAAAILTIRN